MDCLYCKYYDSETSFCIVDRSWIINRKTAYNDCFLVDKENGHELNEYGRKIMVEKNL